MARHRTADPPQTHPSRRAANARRPPNSGLSWSDRDEHGRPPAYDTATAHDLEGIGTAIAFRQSGTDHDLAELTISRLTHDELLTLVHTLAALTNERRTA
ncbi:hypothetical protein [Actinomadura atramentaria]|uniref:hypothetical protein n=1 Tax=Actinomadura atramentaria TaxID=1990 RepID=UPI000366FC6D|nr:hypothetical protein [Actinomadura atramentaria]